MLVYTSAGPNLSVWMTSCSRSFSAKLQQHHLKIPNISTVFFFCGTSTRFRVIALPYGTLRSLSFGCTTYSRIPQDEW